MQWDSFSFDAYLSLTQNQGILNALRTRLSWADRPWRSALVFGTLLAFHYQARRSRLRRLLQLVVFLPFLMPPIITGLSLLIFFRQTGVDRSLLTVVIGHTVFVLALVYRIVLGACRP